MIKLIRKYKVILIHFLEVEPILLLVVAVDPGVAFVWTLFADALLCVLAGVTLEPLTG